MTNSINLYSSTIAKYEALLSKPINPDKSVKSKSDLHHLLEGLNQELAFFKKGFHLLTAKGKERYSHFLSLKRTVVGLQSIFKTGKVEIDSYPNRVKKIWNNFPIFKGNRSGRKTLDKLFQKIISSPIASGLCQKALGSQIKKIRVKLVSNKEAPFGGFFFIDQKIIYIAKNQSFEEKICMLLFELTNLMHASRFKKVEDDVKNGKIRTAMQYAIAYEEIEFDTATIAYKTIKECIKKESWAESYNEPSNYWQNFSKYWDDQLTRGHVEF